MSTENCVICTEVLENKNRIFLGCGHSFHCECIFRLASYDNKKCPLCRESLNLNLPSTELQTRLVESDRLNNSIRNDFSVLNGEFLELKEINDHMEKLLLLKEVEITKTKLEQTLELTKKQQEMELIMSSNMKLREENRRLSSNEILAEKENKIRKLNKKIREIESDNDKLNRDLQEVYTKNIEMTNENERKYKQIMDLIQQMNSTSKYLGSTSRTNRSRQTRNGYLRARRELNSSLRTLTRSTRSPSPQDVLNRRPFRFS